MDERQPKYTGIGRLMIAYGIKLSIDSGLIGDVVLKAKTTILTKHYERSSGAVRLPMFQSSVPIDRGRGHETDLFHQSALRWEVPCVYEETSRLASDAEWYLQKNPESKRFYEIFSRCV